MAKREIKAVTASADIAVIIDRGADVDAQIKNLGFEDKGLKGKITEAAQNQLDEGELSVRLLGKFASATVSGVEKIDLNMSSEQFPKVREAINNGLLSGIVDRTQTLTLPPADVERAAEVLLKAGISAVVAENLKVSAEALRSMSAGRTTSVQQSDALAALSKCLTKDVSFRVKFDKL